MSASPVVEIGADAPCIPYAETLGRGYAGRLGVQDAASAPIWATGFWAKVDLSDENGCWLWLAGVDSNGYGQHWQDKIWIVAHRLAYELLVGPIPDGLQIDHLCRVRRCVNPSHLEPVTHRENTLRGIGPTAINARKTHCHRGHPFDASNTYIKPSGGRDCRECKRLRRLRPATAPALKTHCKWGHEFTAENTYMYGTWRRCIACRRQSNADRYRRLRAAAQQF